MAGSLGLGLQTSEMSAQPAVLSTAPASPTEDALDPSPDLSSREEPDAANTTTTTITRQDPPQHSTAAQFSFGPATQQTVTTVTTTTTVSFPPLIIKPPKDLLDRDLKQYPLAYSPTPEYLKKFCTDLDGRPVRFLEEEDPQETIRRYRELQGQIQRSNGKLRADETKSEYRTPVRPVQAYNKTVHNVRASNAPKRPTPPSIAEAAEIASLQRKSKRPRSALHRTQSEMSDLLPLNDGPAPPANLPLGNGLPVTPDTDAAVTGHLPPRAGASKRKRSPGVSRLRDSFEGEEEDEVDISETSFQVDRQLGPPLFKNSRRHGFADGSLESGASQSAGAVATPPVVETDLDPEEQAESRSRPNLSSLITSSQQDASLPSPSLSPITAAAQLNRPQASRHNAFDTSFGEHVGVSVSNTSGEDLGDETVPAEVSGPSTATAKAQPGASFHSLDATISSQSASSASGPTVMDIPTMVEAFDGMPEAMQTYLIYQFLRRSSKPTLQMVANVVNPALKCDPFNVLPVELGLNITRFLDFKSMCRAAQVSKKWRRLINCDERAWKNLLDRDEFVLPEGEIARAVREGWGWQHPGEDGYEEDLSRQNFRLSPEPGLSPTIPTVISDDEETSNVITRQKRKALLRYSGSKKLKRRSVQVSASALKPNQSPQSAHVRLNRLLASAQGPNCLANAAAQAFPHFLVGLPSLRSMHLFKSIYQRHYLIRKAWMTENSHPKHLAFRAHHRHVVTCLLFDDDKILTGSDDTKINVYNTETGALRNRLEGHEGGVWALQYDGDTLVSGSTDRSVRIWDIRTGRCLHVFQGHTSTVRCLVILKPVQVDTAADGTPVMMPKEPLIITGSRDSSLRVWKLPQPGDRQVFQAGPPANDRDNPYFLRMLTGHHNSVRAIAAHGDTLISGSYDCSVRVWKISTGDMLHRLTGHTQKVYSVILDHERKRCISGSMDNLVKVWDLHTGSCLFNLEGHTSLVGLLDLSHNRLVSAAADSTLRIWDPESGACKATLSAHTGAITCFQHDGHKVISGSDRTLKMWNVRNGECVKDLLTDLSGVWQVRFDQRRCVAAVQRNSLTYIEVLDFGASREGAPPEQRGRRIVVDPRGCEIEDVEVGSTAPAAAMDVAEG